MLLKRAQCSVTRPSHSVGRRRLILGTWRHADSTGRLANLYLPHEFTFPRLLERRREKQATSHGPTGDCWHIGLSVSRGKLCSFIAGAAFVARSGLAEWAALLLLPFLGRGLSSLEYLIHKAKVDRLLRIHKIVTFHVLFNLFESALLGDVGQVDSVQLVPYP